MSESFKNEVFRLQARFLYLEMLFLYAIASFCIISWFPPVFSLLAYEEILRSALKASVLLNMTALILFLLYKFFKGEMRRISIMITDNQIIKKGFSGTTSVCFSDITSLEYIRMPGLRGFLKFSTSDKVLKIPLFMEHTVKFTASLQTRLNEYPKVLANINKTQLYEDATVFQDSYQRSLKAFSPLIMISLLLFFINTIIAVEFWGLALIPILIFAMTGLFLPLIAYHLADVKINQSVRNLLRSDTAQIHNSCMEYLHSGFLTFILYLLVGILFKAVFLWNQ